jgi:hypothetical protein|tara:strand:+ start:90 stop:320 length:231 start_codon:yes stop_codon:yes gene_type:complete
MAISNQKHTQRRDLEISELTNKTLHHQKNESQFNSDLSKFFTMQANDDVQETEIKLSQKNKIYNLVFEEDIVHGTP